MASVDPERVGRAAMRWVFQFALCVCMGSASAADGSIEQTQFDDYSPLTRNTEITRRVLSPLDAAHMALSLSQKHQKLADQPVNLAAEHFLLSLPPVQPPTGYGLLVFLSPWDQVQVPTGWRRELARRGIMLVAPERAGNGQDILGRRIPLALLAEENLRQHYAVDAQRVYVGGFSGGARVAMRLALAYPDVFRGALLNAGSDPIGTAQISLPPHDLFERFQESTRLLYTTGDRDDYHLAFDRQSQASMAEWCVYRIDTLPIRNGDHEMMSAAELGDALDALERIRAVDPARLAACRARLDRSVSEGLDRVETLFGSGATAAATRSLQELDARFGGYTGARGSALIEKVVSSEGASRAPGSP